MVDGGTGLAAAYCAALLGQTGCDVVLLEPPPEIRCGSGHAAVLHRTGGTARCFAIFGRGIGRWSLTIPGLDQAADIVLTAPAVC